MNNCIAVKVFFILYVMQPDISQNITKQGKTTLTKKNVKTINNISVPFCFNYFLCFTDEILHLRLKFMLFIYSKI